MRKEVFFVKIRDRCTSKMGGVTVKMTKTRRALQRSKRVGLRIIAFAILCLLIVASVGKVQLRQKGKAYQQREEELLSAIAEEEARTKEIEELKKYVQTKKYIEEVAKERLGLVYEDEILFKAVE